MSDEQAVKPDQDAQAASGAQGGGVGDDAGDGQGTAPPAAATLTQAEVDRLVQARLDRERAKAEKSQAALQAELDAYKQAEEARKQAEMSELEKAQAAAAAAEERAAAAEAARVAAEVKTLRVNLLAIEAADLPTVYRDRVTGATEDEIKASIAAAQAAYVGDRDALLGQLATMTPEQVAALGEAGKPLAGRIVGQPVSIGAPPASGQAAAPAEEWSPDNNTPEAWKRERVRRGIGVSSLTR